MDNSERIADLLSELNYLKAIQEVLAPPDPQIALDVEYLKGEIAELWFSLEGI